MAREFTVVVEDADLPVLQTHLGFLLNGENPAATSLSEFLQYLLDQDLETMRQGRAASQLSSKEWADAKRRGMAAG
jgi:hypothetical protein